jgi:hypothetical protein
MVEKLSLPKDSVLDSELVVRTISNKTLSNIERKDHLTGVSHDVYLMDVHLMGVYLIDVHLTGVYLMTSRLHLTMVADLSRSEFARYEFFVASLSLLPGAIGPSAQLTT